MADAHYTIMRTQVEMRANRFWLINQKSNSTTGDAFLQISASFMSKAERRAGINFQSVPRDVMYARCGREHVLFYTRCLRGTDDNNDRPRLL